MTTRPSIRGRGAAHDPPNRFDPIEIDREAWVLAGDPDPETRFYRDGSRSIIATNDSPDVGFEASVNPYRGCENGCVWCLDPETPVLMAGGSLRAISDLNVGDEIYGTKGNGRSRRYVRTTVLAHWETWKPAFRIALTDGTELVASGDHRFLTRRGWKPVTGTERGGDRRPGLTSNDRMLGTDVTDPVIGRKRTFEGRSVESAVDLRVVSIEPVGWRSLFDITTGTGDFIANGLVSHNCYARPSHEYLGLSAGLDFETKIFVKEDAPELLRKALSSPTWEPKTIAMSGVTDPYQPAESRFRLTRRCLEVLEAFRNPVAIVTKRHTVTRDADVLASLARHDAALVNLSITSLDRDLQRVMEPRASTPRKRLEAIAALADAGIPTGVMVAPVIPGLTDHEMPAILEAAARAGAVRASFIVLRLPHGVKDLFADWLERHFPDRKEKVMNRMRSLRGGRLNDPRFGSRMRGAGPYADQIRSMFEVGCRKAGLNRTGVKLSTAAFRRPGACEQLGLFGRSS